MNLEEFKENDKITMLYCAQADEIDEILKKTDKSLENRLEMKEMEKSIENCNCKKELKNILKKIEDNYNIKITEYNKQMYKQGFIDGVNIILNCFKK